MDGLLGLVPPHAVVGGMVDPRVPAQALRLRPAGPGVFEASFRAPDRGTVVLIPFPGSAGYDPQRGELVGHDLARLVEQRYPAPVTITVRAHAPSPHAAGLAALLGVLALGIARVWRGSMPGPLRGESTRPVGMP